MATGENLEGVSIVICTYNGRNNIGSAINSVFSQNNLSLLQWELIVVDNASTDGTFDYCSDLMEKSPHSSSCKLIREPLPGAAIARRRGLLEAKHSWILFVDDDNQLDSDYLETGWSIIKENPGMGVLGGQGTAVFEESAPDWFINHSLSFAVGSQAPSTGRLSKKSNRKIYSAGGFFNRIPLLDYFERGFVPIMIGPNGNELTRGEDSEWCMMIELSGYFLYYSGELRFRHMMPKERMTWDYLERLKVGKASGIARFQAYAPFYLKNQPGIIIFWRLYLEGMIKSQLLALKYRLLKGHGNREFSLGRKVIKAKAFSYIKNIMIAFRHFKKVRKILNSINYGNSF